MASCPACLGPLAAWRTAPAAEPGYPDVALARCAACGTAVTLGDAPLALLRDSGAYGDARPRGAGLARPLLDAFDRRRLALLAPWVGPGARLLDAGAGRGRFVAHARAAGYDADGVEPSARGVRAAREVHGVALQAATLEAAAVAPGSVEVLTLWHVLEHLPDPAAELELLHGWLAPDGVLLVGVPDLGSWQARVGGRRWFHLDLPRHRTHLTTPGLHALLRRTGFEPLATDHRGLEHDPFGLWQSAVNRVTRRPSWLYNALKRNAPLACADALVTLAALPLLPVAVAVEALAGRRGRGGTVAVVARRRPGASGLRSA